MEWADTEGWLYEITTILAINWSYRGVEGSSEGERWESCMGRRNRWPFHSKILCSLRWQWKHPWSQTTISGQPWSTLTPLQGATRTISIEHPLSYFICHTDLTRNVNEIWRLRDRVGESKREGGKKGEQKRREERERGEKREERERE